MGFILHPLGKMAYGKISIIDAEVLDCAWQKMKSGYAFRNPHGGEKHVYLHRLIMQRLLNRSLKSDECIDHINHNRSDNRRENLRLVTKSQNTQNMRLASDNTSGYKGVWYKRDGRRIRRWIAEIHVGGKKITLGSYHSAKDAARIYNAAALKYFGIYAEINHVPD